MDRPRIGVTTSLNTTEQGAKEQRLDLAYVRAVERAGGLPLVVPMLASDEAADAFAALLDGLVVTGGPAVTLGMVGERPADLAETDPERTASDVRLLRSAFDAGLPTLGVCYGMQLASALRGGTIWADAERDRPDTSVHSSKRGGPDHEVQVADGTRLRRVVGAGPLRVGARHIQALADVGAGLVVSAVAPDGVVEAVETTDGAFVGVQFHPEALQPPLDALFVDLVERSRTWRAGRAET
ncbi:MAG TPA: gamma-glutamyl-gamma-aminobutyrate hydrolase family protein, partial [Rubricoccaceae bacterium]